MPDHKFIYTGKELAEPLSALISELKNERKSLLEESASPQEPIKRNMLTLYDDVSMKILNKESRLKELSGDISKAENWLRECNRTPKVAWTLNFQELSWLYRGSNA